MQWGSQLKAMSEWLWAAACALSIPLAAPVVARAVRRGAPHACLALVFLILGYVLLAALFLADAIVGTWPDATLRFARGCVAGLAVGAILGALGLVLRAEVRRR